MQKCSKSFQHDETLIKQELVYVEAAEAVLPQKLAHLEREYQKRAQLLQQMKVLVKEKNVSLHKLQQIEVTSQMAVKSYEKRKNAQC